MLDSKAICSEWNQDSRKRLAFNMTRLLPTLRLFAGPTPTGPAPLPPPSDQDPGTRQDVPEPCGTLPPSSSCLVRGERGSTLRGEPDFPFRTGRNWQQLETAGTCAATPADTGVTSSPASPSRRDHGRIANRLGGTKDKGLTLDHSARPAPLKVS